MNENTSVILRWEKWRIVYNLVLLAEGLWLLRNHLAAAFSKFGVLIVLIAIGANVCYCIGPCVEIGVRRIAGLFAGWTRRQSFLAGFHYSLFAAGLLFSMWMFWMFSLRGLPKLEDAKHRDVVTGLRKLAEGVGYFQAYVGRYPTTAEGLQALVECPKDVSPKDWHGPYHVSGRNGSRKMLRLNPDPWGQEYRYTYAPQGPNGPNCEIVSAGPDGQFGTRDDIKFEY